MSSDTRLFIVTEGPEVDPTFYSRVAQSHPDHRVRSARVLPVEQIGRDLDPAIGAGRSAVKAVFAYLQEHDLLLQRNGRGEQAIVCAIDADLSADAEVLRDQPNLLVTFARDVEAEVFAQASLTRVIESLAFMDKLQAQEAAERLGDWLRVSADKQKLWILLGLTAQSGDCLSRIRWMGSSLVNHDATMAVDGDRADHMIVELTKMFSTREAYERALVSSAVRLIILHDLWGPSRLLKGKWLPQLFARQLAEAVPDLRQPVRQIAAASTRAFLDAVDFSGTWADPYREKLTSAFGTEEVKGGLSEAA